MNLFGPNPGVQDDAFRLRLFNFFECGRHLFAIFQTYDVHFLRAHAKRGERDVDHFFRGDGGDVLFGRRQFFHPRSMLTQHFASRRARHVHGHIAAANDQHISPNRELVSQVDVEQEIYSAVHAVEIHARDGQVAAAVCANGQQNRVESLLPKLGNLEVAAGAVIELQRNVSGPENLAHLRFDHIARQTIFGDAQVEHSRRPLAPPQKWLPNIPSAPGRAPQKDRLGRRQPPPP